MPFMKKSNKSVESEDASSPNLSIALSVQRKNKRKKMANGGAVDISASNESRPMPSDEHADAKQANKVSKKPLKSADWTDDTWSDQASKSFSKSPDAAADHDFVTEGKALADNAVTPEEMAMIRKHRIKMANGGAVPSAPSTEESPFEDEMENDRASKQLAREHSREALARGGEVSPQDEIDEDNHASVAAAIMAKRKRMADGGMVDLEENAEEGPADLDSLNEEAALKEQYDDSQLSAQPMDSNEHGDDIDSDEHDMISSIRRKMKSKRS